MQNHQKMKGLRFIHVYEVRPRRQVRRRSNFHALPFGRLWSRRIALESFLIAGRQIADSHRKDRAARKLPASPLI
jgi:hypothetical protein